MPTISVNEGQIFFHYEDTGPPTDDTNNTYITLLLLHGTYWTSEIFRPLIPYAKERNLRLILLNQRNYPGSSPYLDEDIRVMQSYDEEKQRLMVRRLGHIQGQAIASLIQTLKIPPLQSTSDDSLQGGLSFVAWSAGNIILFQFMSSLDTLDSPSRSLITSHLRSVVLYEPAMYISGTNPEFVSRESENRTSGLWSPLRDKNVASQINELFEGWISTYSSPISQLPSFDPVKYEETHDRMHTRISLDKAPTSTGLERDIVYEGFWFVSSNLRQIRPELLRENVLRSLTRLEDGTEERSWGLHPKFKAILIWCDQSATDCILGASAIAQYHTEWQRQGYRMRSLEVVKIEDANHFAHSDDPEGFVDLLAKHI